VNGRAIERLTKLPASKHKYLTRDYEDQVKNAAKMLKILEATPTEPEYVLEWLLNGRWSSCSSPMSKKMAMATLKRKTKKLEFRVVPYTPDPEPEEDEEDGEEG
jgi:hypothetical protein